MKSALRWLWTLTMLGLAVLGIVDAVGIWWGVPSAAMLFVVGQLLLPDGRGDA